MITVKMHCVECGHEFHRALCPATACECYFMEDENMIKKIKQKLKAIWNSIVSKFWQD